MIYLTGAQTIIALAIKILPGIPKAPGSPPGGFALANENPDGDCRADGPDREAVKALPNLAAQTLAVPKLTFGMRRD